MNKMTCSLSASMKVLLFVTHIQKQDTNQFIGNLVGWIVIHITQNNTGIK